MVYRRACLPHGLPLLASVAVALVDDELSLLQAKATVVKAWPQELSGLLAGLHDPATQRSTCQKLTSLVPTHREELLTAAVINPVVDAIKNNVADLDVVYSCFDFLQAFTVTFDRPATLAINNGTYIGEAVAAVLRFYPYNRKVQGDALLHVSEFSTLVACETQPPYEAAGCLELVWDVLEHFPGRENSDVQMSAWQAFSDHSYCAPGAEAIANHGGRCAGVPRIVHALKEAVGNDFRPPPSRGGSVISLQYEIMAVANGLLQSYRDCFDSFVSAGYGTAVLASMRDQPEERSAVDRGCAALEMLSENKAVRAQLLADGALEIATAAMERYKGEDHVAFMNTEMSHMYPVLPRCDGALRHFADGNLDVQDELLRLGVLETYGSMSEGLLPNYPEMAELPALLLTRRASRAWAPKLQS